MPRLRWEEVPFHRKPWARPWRRGQYVLSFQTELPFGLALAHDDQWLSELRQFNELPRVADDRVLVVLTGSAQPARLPQHLSVLPDWNVVMAQFLARALPEGRTLAELVIRPGPKWEPADEVLTRCFDQGLEALNRLLMEYGIATMDPEVHEVAKEELPALTLVTFKDLKAPHYAHTFLRLHDRDGLIKEPMTEDMLEQIAHRVEEPLGHPGLHAFHIHRVRADRLIDQGRYAQSIIAAAVAIEALLAWLISRHSEELGRDPSEGERQFEDQGVLSVVRSQLHPWLRGSWNVDDPSTPAGHWRMRIHDVRTSCVHRGYRPTYREALAALEAGKVLSEFVFKRLRQTGRSDWLEGSVLIFDPLKGTYAWDDDCWKLIDRAEEASSALRR